MTDVGILERDDNKILRNAQRHKLMASRMAKIHESSTSETLFRSIFTILFTFVYFVFSIFYLLDYKQSLFNILFTEGVTAMLASKEFLNCVRDLLLITVGYLALFSVLRRIMFGRNEY